MALDWTNIMNLSIMGVMSIFMWESMKFLLSPNKKSKELRNGN